MRKTKLGPEDWVRAALEAIAERGISGVAVEPLSARVGASKGSFYWHFSDRRALIEAALREWEKTRTTALMRELEAIDDARERMRRLFASTFGNPAAARLELSLALGCHHPAVRPVVRRVTSRRLAFVADALGELGLDPVSARSRALAAYSMHLGLFTVREARRDALPSRAALDAYTDELLDVLVRR